MISTSKKIQLIRPSLFLALALASCFVLPAANATTVAVGSCTNFIYFTTIQTAVNSVPAGSTIEVCPGIYPEQVRITKKLTLKGIASGGSNAAVIVPPMGGLVANATSTFSGNPIEAMVLIQNTTATIEDVTVDGTGNLTSCGQDPIGIFYQNASGTITRNNVIHIQVVGGFGCQGGLGIYVQSGATTSAPNPSPAANAVVTITYNNVHDYDKNGITADGTQTGESSNVNVTVSHNTVIGAGEVSDNAQNGIQLWGANGTVTYNFLDGDWYVPPPGDTDYVATGILVITSYAPTISNNTISNTNVGIYLLSINPDDTDSATLASNTITATHIDDGIVLCANLSTATGNTFNVADESGFNVAACGDASPTNTLTSNTINGACTGVLIDPPAAATINTPTYYNVTTQVLTTNTDTCTPPLAPLVKRQRAAGSHPAASPAGRKLAH